MNGAAKLLYSVRTMLRTQCRLHDTMIAAHHPWDRDLHWVRGQQGWELRGTYAPPA